MSRTHRRYLVSGAAFSVVGLLVVMWYNTTVMHPDEITRLEAGGEGMGGIAELGMLGLALVCLMTGLSLMIYAWSGRRGRRPQPRPITHEIKRETRETVSS